MSDPATSPEATAQRVRASLHEVAEKLRGANHLEADSQKALADLLEELSRTLDPGTLRSEETTHLAESAATLARGLHQRPNASFLAAAKERLEEAALRAEAEAPLATGIARRLLDTLANLGI